MSHEIYKNKDFYAAAVDIWALGVILFIMLTGEGRKEGMREERREEGREGRRAIEDFCPLWGGHFHSIFSFPSCNCLLIISSHFFNKTSTQAYHPWRPRQKSIPASAC